METRTTIHWETRFVFLLILFLNAFILSADNKINFTSITSEHGLSHNTVLDIKQDTLGVMWFATTYGLNSFDGETFKNFYHIADDKNSISSNYVYSLLPVGKQILSGTSEGLSVFNLDKQKFTNYHVEQEVLDLTCSNDPNKSYFITENKIYSYNHHLQTINKELDINLSKVKEIAYDLNGDRLLLGSSEGVYVYDLTSKIFSLFSPVLKDIFIQKVLVDGDNIWVATEGSGLFRFNGEKLVTNYRQDNPKETSISSDFVRSLSKDSDGNIWVGTFIGLSIIHPTGAITKTYFNQYVNSSLSQNSVRALFHDNQGGVWVGTYFGGVNYYHPLLKQFNSISTTSKQPLSDGIISSLYSCSVDPNTLWIGTNEGGLNEFNLVTQTNSINQINNYSLNLLSKNVKAVLFDKGYYYIGTHGGGLTRFERATGVSKTFTLENSNLPSNNIYSLVSRKSEIWLGTLAGLVVYDTKNERLTRFKALGALGEGRGLQVVESSKVFCLLKDAQDQLWIGTDKGFYVFNLKTKVLEQIPLESRIKNKSINTIYEDATGKIWVGTSVGLFSVDPNSKLVLPINSINESSYIILSILQDNAGKYWFGTNKGLVNYDPEQDKSKIFTSKDGLINNQFTPNAQTKRKDGLLYFGTINGVIYFDPSHISENPFTPKPFVTSLQVSSNTVFPGDDTGILDNDISLTNKISLPPNADSFALKFSVPNYLSMFHNYFAYKLVGINKDWVLLSGNTLSYASLKPGTYTLQYKAANSEGKWSEVSQMTIIINPYWWQTSLFKLLFFLLVVGLIYLFVWIYLNKQKIKSELQIELLKQAQKDEINQMKLRFFINVSHEFRTPLTLILSPIEELLKKATLKGDIELLSYIKRNANRLLFLVNQLLEYRQTELGVFPLKVQYSRIDEFMHGVIGPFKSLALKKNINFNINSTCSSSDEALFDPSYLDLIISNLLSNAFKFTPEKGSIDIHWEVSNKLLIIKIKDTGCGINKEDLDKVFQRFYQTNHQIKGTGIGLAIVRNLVDSHHADIAVDSDVSIGTSFEVRIPQDRARYVDSEINLHPEEQSINHFAGVSMEYLQEETPQVKSAYVESRESILIVEDDVEISNYLASTFKETVNVFMAVNGEEALEIVNDEKIDLVISDVMMANMDGLRLCKIMKQNIRTNHIPIILLTAKSSEEDQIEGLTMGADDYIMKPFKIEVLKLKVANILKQRRRVHEYYSNSNEINPENLAANDLDKEFLEKAKEIIADNLDNADFKVDDFCQLIGMSRSNLHLKMKAITGESTIEFIKKMRFNKACTLLLSGRYTISEISTMVGFNTPSYFTTSFKKQFGVLPTEYIKINSNK